MPLPVETTISHYRIISKLGAGGMGEVYLAADTRLDRKVALKILPEQFTKDESRLRRFVQEAKATSALNHPNIITIHEIGEAPGEFGGTHFIASEFIDGHTLRGVMTSGQLQLSDALDIASQVASALAAAHAAGIVHRDIKPENVIVRPDSLVKVLDFGLAKLTARPSDANTSAVTAPKVDTEAGVVMGTARYMSPEQVRGQEIDARTDIFSFGVVLYEMIAGRPPFQGSSTSDVIASILTREPLPLSRVVPETPPELVRIVSKSLEKDREERYQRIKDLLLDLKRLKKRLQFEAERVRSGDTATTTKESVSPKPVPAPPSRILQALYRPRAKVALVALSLMVIALAAVGYRLLWRTNEGSVDAPIRTIAVLPFKPLVVENRNEALEFGMADTLISKLSGGDEVVVRPLSASRRYTSLEQDSLTAGRELGVESILDGTIQRWGNQIRISVKLFRTSDGKQLWAEQFDEKFTDIFVVQDSISEKVAAALKVRLGGRGKRHATENIEAYQLYMKGRYHLSKLTPSEMHAAASYYQQAIAIDPSYALAYAELASTLRGSAIAGEKPAHEVFPRAKEAALKAVQLDETLADGYDSLGQDSFWYDWNWSGAETQFRRALSLDPNYAHAHMSLALLLSTLGRHVEALAEAKRARELDPLDLPLLALEGHCLILAGRTDEALDRLRKTAELEPNFWMPHLFAASAYIEKGMYPEAIAESAKEKELWGTNVVAFGAYALAKSGRQAEARAQLDDLLKSSTTRYVSPYRIAFIYNALAMHDKALEWLEKGYEQRDPQMTVLNVEPKWSNLRNEPRFVELRKRMRFD